MSKEIVAKMFEKYGEEITKMFHAKLEEVYQEDYIVPSLKDMDNEAMWDELFCYLSGSMDEVFDEIDQDGMVGEGQDLVEW